VEPLLDPAVEVQAIGRVHRIGQERSTTVHRFVVEATVEENVYRICAARTAAMDMRAAVHRAEAPLTVRCALAGQPHEHPRQPPPFCSPLCS
jgi:E3 ubiquitin-protein ligase SHPRH